MYGLVYAHMVDYAKKEGFASGGSAAPMVAAFIGIVLLVIIQLFVIKFLWNTVLVRVLSIARPLPSMLYTLGLLVLVAMVHPGYTVSTTA